MRVIVEQLVEWRLAGETEVLGENLPQRLWNLYFVHKLSKVNECTSKSLHITVFRTWRPFQPVVEWIYAGPLILISIITIMQYVGPLHLKKKKNYFQLTSIMFSVFFLDVK
jgi:hypothetical protein